MKYRFTIGQNKKNRTICIEASNREEAEIEIRKDFPNAQFLTEVIKKNKIKQNQ